MTEEITKSDLVEMIRRIQHTVEANKEVLSKLDTEIGDGDHGFGMAKGFKAFADKLGDFSQLDIGGMLKKGGFELIKSMGGASGAIFGTMFTAQGQYYEKNLVGKESLALDDMTRMLCEALEQIKNRGHAQAGDKTMIDAFEPAIDALSKAVDDGLGFRDAFINAANAAEMGAGRTKEMVATHGRAKNLGERSIGHMDPGAKSTSYIFRAIADYFS
jgi:dihydroxyacetone kinase-like protein